MKPLVSQAYFFPNGGVVWAVAVKIKANSCLVPQAADQICN